MAIQLPYILMTKIEKIIKQHNILTLSQASKITGIPAENLKKKLQRGTLPGYKLGSIWLIQLDNLGFAPDNEKRKEST